MANIIVVGTGGVRAYRQIELAEELILRGHKVRLLNTNNSLYFLFAFFLTNPKKMFVFLRLSHRPIFAAFDYIVGFLFKSSIHVNIAHWANVVAVVPSTCNTLSKISNGLTDNFPLLVIRALTKGKKVIIAPSMNPEMWSDPATQLCVTQLKKMDKYVLVGPIEEVAYGTGKIGMGVIAANQDIIATIESAINS